MRSGLIAATALLFASGAAQAEDTDRCWPGNVCASAPKTVMDALAKAELAPVMGEDSLGDPRITVEYDGWTFAVLFYGCVENENCDSLQFSIVFEDDGNNTLELANAWNAAKRFGQLSVGPKNELQLSYDLATIGGVNEQNFIDVLSWWVTMLAELADFFEERGLV